MSDTAVSRRIPYVAMLLVCWLWQVSPATGWVTPAWQPQLLLILFIYGAVRWSVRHSILMALLMGWLMASGRAEAPVLVCAFWVGVVFMARWIKHQVYTEHMPVYVGVAWLMVMGWHGVGWLIRWRTGDLVEWWNPMFVATQTVVTVSVAWLWAQYGTRWVRV